VVAAKGGYSRYPDSTPCQDDPRPDVFFVRHPPPPDPVTTPTIHEIEESQPLHTYKFNPLETIYADLGRKHKELQLIPNTSPFDAPPPDLVRSWRNATRVHLTERVNNQPVNAIPQAPHPFTPQIPHFSGPHSLTHPKRTQLEYLQDMDSFADQNDIDSQLWTPSRIISHKVFQPTFQLRYYVAWEWNDTDGTWVDGKALWLQCPDLVLTYVTTHHLSDNPSFRWLQDTHTTNANLAHVYKANTDPKAPKFKFGEEVPRSVKHALLLDTTKGYSYDDSWQCAIDKELNQLREYHTFRPLHHGERLSDYQRIPYHLVFDVKFDLRKKARLVQVATMLSHLKKTYTPVSLTSCPCASVSWSQR
jgi:hypothetical protein